MTRILVIDDEAPLRERLLRILAFEGYDVADAADGLSGVREARAFRPDIVLCDLAMPQLNGFGTVAALRGFPETSDARIIVVSAAAEDSSRRFVMEHGADAYLAKPFSTAALLGAVRVQERLREGGAAG